MTPRFLLRIVASADATRVGEEVLVDREIIIGRDTASALVLADSTVSRRHARAEPAPGGVRLIDLGSQNGLWQNDTRVSETVLAPGDSCRVGSTVVECLSDAPAQTDSPDPDGTVVMSDALLRHLSAPHPPAVAPPDRAPEASPLDSLGETIPLDAHRPLLLSDPALAWRVVSGSVLVFTVKVERGEPVGARKHFLDILPGGWFFGFDLARYGATFGLLAVATQGTRVSRARLADLKYIAADARHRAAVGALLDQWILTLAGAMAASGSEQGAIERVLAPGREGPLAAGTRYASADRVVWLQVTSGALLVNGIACPVFDAPVAPIPVTPMNWIEMLGDASEERPAPLTTTEALGDALVWQGLDQFHQAVCECQFVNRQLSVVDEYLRLQEKAQKSDEAAEAGYDAMGSVLGPEREARPRIFSASARNPLLRACALVGEAQGIEVKAPPDTKDPMTYEQALDAVASTSGFRTRQVALREAWWKADHGALLARQADSGAPVALVPSGRCRYAAVDPESGARTPVDASVARSLAPFAFSFYRPLPDGAIGVWDLVRFGAWGVRRDALWIAAMGTVLGLIGIVTPYLSGEVLDVALPQADRGMLLGFGLALFAAAMATSLYRFTQDVATIRVQARMAVRIQAAVWDRILNLPLSFFRQFAAGDLADRAAGVEAIQNLVAGAGVAAVLGSISGLFYVAQMFAYDTGLALLAVGLTIVFVGVNTASNLVQLRYYRDGMHVRGRIAGLTLNLLTGVSKLRTAGAEQHAFRVWAEQFAKQRRLTYASGTVQNLTAVFSTVFTVLSMMAIFFLVAGDSVAGRDASGLTTGQFVAFTSAFGLFLSAMQGLGDASVNLVQTVPIYERMRPILTTVPEADPSKAFPGVLSGAIELSHVSFRYSADGPWIIRDLSLRIEPGEFVAFVGPSGCGKSTVLRLMLGFEQPASGSIRYNGQDLASLDVRMVRRQIGVVLQVSRVMPAEIYRNIIGVSPRTIDDAWQAAEQAGIADDIRQMPMGMYTYVSEGGSTLSGGQRQRLMIARAIVNRPKILFLDEATSALDNQTQATVTESLDRMDATRIVIAHRLSTIINADRICYLHAGRIIESGTCHELMAKNGAFARLAERQLA